MSTDGSNQDRIYRLDAKVVSKAEYDAASQATKHDASKIQVELLSAPAMLKIGQVLTFGAKKYSAHNWRKGMPWSRLLGAALRHIFAYMSGESKDPETGLSHLAHASCCLMFLLEYEETHQQLDDRWKP